jgi:lipopolysaccharide/colanic/teichoic acid biosynthesis glycosyltransferase
MMIDVTAASRASPAGPRSTGCAAKSTLEKARARLEYNLLYIEQWSLWLDLKTLALTIPAVPLRQST